MNYSEAYDKIITAYFNDQIEPLNANFCFCGTLCNNEREWCLNSAANIHNDSHGYLGKDLGKMEKALFDGLEDKNYMGNISPFSKTNTTYEERLFNGMCAALEVLKQIHIERGEIIDEGLTLTKREKQTVEN